VRLCVYSGKDRCIYLSIYDYISKKEKQHVSQIFHNYVHLKVLATSYLIDPFFYLIKQQTEYSLASCVSCGETYPLRVKSLTWCQCLHFSRFILGFNDNALLVISDMLLTVKRSLWLRQPRQPKDYRLSLNLSKVLIGVVCARACIHSG